MALDLARQGAPGLHTGRAPWPSLPVCKPPCERGVGGPGRPKGTQDLGNKPKVTRNFRYFDGFSRFLTDQAALPGPPAQTREAPSSGMLLIPPRHRSLLARVPDILFRRPGTGVLSKLSFSLHRGGGAPFPLCGNDTGNRLSDRFCSKPPIIR